MKAFSIIAFVFVAALNGFASEAHGEKSVLEEVSEKWHTKSWEDIVEVIQDKLLPLQTEAVRTECKTALAPILDGQFADGVILLKKISILSQTQGDLRTAIYALIYRLDLTEKCFYLIQLKTKGLASESPLSISLQEAKTLVSSEDLTGARSLIEKCMVSVDDAALRQIMADLKMALSARINANLRKLGHSVQK